MFSQLQLKYNLENMLIILKPWDEYKSYFISLED